MSGSDAFRVRVTDAERAAGVLSEATAAEAHSRFAEHGCLVVEGLFEPGLIERVRESYDSQLGALTHEELRALCAGRGRGRYLEVGHARYEIVPRMVGAFGDPGVFAHPGLLSLARHWLGVECQLNSFTVVVSYPGSELQHLHRDHAYLFEADDLSTTMPPYALNVGIALIDVDVANGPTGVFPGSHRWPAARVADPAEIVPVPLARGDCLVTDFRTVHAGMSNTSSRPRPNLYISYSRPWFFDEGNHTTRLATDMPVGAYASIASLRVLLRRATARRAQEAAAPIAERRPSDAATRPCPCGSGMVHEECHGRAVVAKDPS